MKDSRAMTALRFLADPKSGILAKLFMLFAVAYVIMPFDLIPDVIVVVGWLDDLAVVIGATTTLMMAMRTYRDKRAARMAAQPQGQPGLGRPLVVETDGREVG